MNNVINMRKYRRKVIRLHAKDKPLKQRIEEIPDKFGDLDTKERSKAIAKLFSKVESKGNGKDEKGQE